MIQRIDIVTQVTSQLRSMIEDCELAGGVRINETHLAQRLGVSRTPVREALGRLVGEGAVISLPHLGFFVTELSEAELDEIYCLRPILDVAALRLGGLPDAHIVARMIVLNSTLESVATAKEAVTLDEQWHGLLLSRCTNAPLLDFIARLMVRTRRYELILFNAPAQRLDAVAEHQQVILALESGDLERACVALAANLTRGDAPLRKAIATRIHVGAQQ